MNKNNPFTSFKTCLLLSLFCVSNLCVAQQITWSNATFINKSSAEVGVADIDKDGNVDIVIAGALQRWYAGPDFTTAYDLGDSDGGPYAARVADINNDGWPDFITSDGERTGTNSGEIYVYLNPGATTGSAGTKVKANWTRITAYSGAVYHQNDMRIVDMDGDGRLDIIERTWASQRVVISFQNANINNWTTRVFDTGETGKPEGISAGDIDGDGDMEIVLSGVYWDNPDGWRTGTQVEYLVDPLFQGSTYGKVKSAVGDIDLDGDQDIYMGSAEGSDRYLAWYENEGVGANGGVILTKHIIKDNFGKCHMVQLIDIDRDGDLDLATGRSFGQKGLLVFYNNYTPQNGVSWTEQNYDPTGEIYTGVVADLDGDFDLDVVGPSTFYRNSTRYYKNLTPVNPPEPLTVTPSTLNYAVAGGTQSASIETNEAWTISTNQSWLSANTSSGNGDTNISVITQTHSGFGDRSGVVTVDNGTNQKTILVTQEGQVDSAAPSVPQGLTGSSVGYNTFNLDWTASTDNSGNVREYIIYLNGAEHSRALINSTVVAGLTQLTNYSVQVSAVDASGNESELSIATVVITTARPPSEPPVAQWRLDETSGFTALESITARQDSLFGISVNQWTAGKLGNGLQLNTDAGDDEGIDLGNLDAPANNLTISAWIRPSDLINAPEGRIIAKATGINQSQHFWMLSTIKNGDVFVPRVRLRTNGSVTTLIGSQSENVTQGEWSHVATTYDGATLNLYLNGANVASTPKTGTIDQDGTVGATIGNIPAGERSTRAFRGTLDDVCLFDISLSPDDIADIYNGGVGTTCDNFGEAANDVTAPVLQEVTPVSTPTTDTTPEVVVSSNEAGTLSFTDDCASITTQAVAAGQLTLSLPEFSSFGTFSNCGIVVTDAANNASETLILTEFEIVEPDTTKPIVAVNQAIDQADPSTSNLARYVVLFSELIDASTFTVDDISLTGTTTGSVTVGPVALSDDSEFTFSVTGMTSGETVVASIDADKVQDLAGNENEASTQTDNQVTYQCGDCIIDDQDNDGVEDSLDNCPMDSNPNQTDSNNNGTGDACENDDFCFTIKTRINTVAVICL